MYKVLNAGVPGIVTHYVHANIHSFRHFQTFGEKNRIYKAFVLALHGSAVPIRNKIKLNKIKLNKTHTHTHTYFLKRLFLWVTGGAGAYSSCLWVEGRIHPGQVASPSQG